MSTHHQKPVLYSGAGGAGYAARKNQNIGLNPDNYALFDDFLGVAVDSTNAWTVVKDTGAAVAIAADTVGGELTLTSTATTDNDGASIQGNEVFAAASGRDIWFECRVKTSTAAQCDLFFGLTENFATDPEAVLTASNRIGFQVADGDASILCKSEASDTETSTDSGEDLADATYVKLALLVEGTGSVRYFVNGKQVAQHSTNIPTANLALAAFSLSGQATGTTVTTLDYILGSSTR